MPTYEFRCSNGHDFEKFYRTISGAEAQAACPVCGELAERIMSPTSFAFKGSGFYLTDYGKNAHRDKGSAPKSSASDSGTSDGGNSSSSDVKSEASKSESSKSESSKGESAKSGSGTSAASTGGSPSPAPPAESKPAGPKKSSGE